MPRKEIKYQNTVIYKIQHIEKNDLLYVGHTTDFVKRKCKHKYDCTNINSSNYNGKVYSMIRQNGGWDMFKMIEVKKFPCNDRREADAEEDKIMKELKANMNAYNAVLDLVARKFNGLEYSKQYYKKNKESIILKKNKIVVCDCGCSITKQASIGTRHKESKKHIDGLKRK